MLNSKNKIESPTNKYRISFMQEKDLNLYKNALQCIRLNTTPYSPRITQDNDDFYIFTHNFNTCKIYKDKPVRKFKKEAFLVKMCEKQVDIKSNKTACLMIHKDCMRTLHDLQFVVTTMDIMKIIKNIFKHLSNDLHKKNVVHRNLNDRNIVLVGKYRNLDSFDKWCFLNYENALSANLQHPDYVCQLKNLDLYKLFDYYCILKCETIQNFIPILPTSIKKFIDSFDTDKDIFTKKKCIEKVFRDLNLNYTYVLNDDVHDIKTQQETFLNNVIVQTIST